MTTYEKIGNLAASLFALDWRLATGRMFAKRSISVRSAKVEYQRRITIYEFDGTAIHECERRQHQSGSKSN
jgi:hypothetical protein